MTTPESHSQEQPQPRSKYNLNTEAAAVYLGKSPQTLSLWRSTKKQLIPFVKVGRQIYYSRDDLDQWLETRRGTEPNAQRKRQRERAKSSSLA